MEAVKEVVKGKINFQIKRLTSRRPKAWNWSLIIVLIQNYQRDDYTKGHSSNSFLERIHEGGGMEGPRFMNSEAERMITDPSQPFFHPLQGKEFTPKDGSKMYFSKTMNFILKMLISHKSLLSHSFDHPA